MFGPRRIPISLFPGDWCYNCSDPSHDQLAFCPILTAARKIDGSIEYIPCGCEDNLVLGKQDEYLVIVKQLQLE